MYEKMIKISESIADTIADNQLKIGEALCVIEIVFLATILQVENKDKRHRTAMEFIRNITSELLEKHVQEINNQET